MRTASGPQWVFYALWESDRIRRAEAERLREAGLPAGGGWRQKEGRAVERTENCDDDEDGAWK